MHAEIDALGFTSAQHNERRQGILYPGRLCCKRTKFQETHMEKDTAIEVKNLTKIYKLYDKPIDRLKDSLGLARKNRYRSTWPSTT